MANRHQYVFLLINGSLVRARAGEPNFSSDSITYTIFDPETHRLIVFWSMEIDEFGTDVWAHNPLVGGSSPPGPTISIKFNTHLWGQVLLLAFS